jgi:hypothetical protein
MFYAEDFRAITGDSKTDFYATLERNGRRVDIRRFVAGEEKTSSPLLLLITDFRGGLLVQLWECMREQP